MCHLLNGIFNDHAPNCQNCFPFFQFLWVQFLQNVHDWSSPNFYRAMLCIRGTSHGYVSVSVSVTSRCSTKMAKHRITQTKPHDSPETLVFWRQRSPRNSTGVTPYGGAKCRWGGSKSAPLVVINWLNGYIADRTGSDRTGPVGPGPFRP